MVAGAYAVIGAVVPWALGPSSMLVVLRMGIGALIPAALFFRSLMWRELRQFVLARPLLLMGVLDAVTLLLFVVSARDRHRRRRVPGLPLPAVGGSARPGCAAATDGPGRLAGFGIAMGGLALIITPPATGETLELSASGIAAGLVSGLSLAGFSSW